MRMFKNLSLRLLISFMVLAILLIPTVQAWEYSGIGGSGGHASSLSGGWNAFVIGVRATAVDIDGKRLSVEIDGRKYISKSIDYYGNLSQINNGYFAQVNGSSEHSTCRLANGTVTLCSKPELEGARFSSQNGGYKYEAWPYQNVAPLPVGMNFDSAAGVSQLSNSLSKLGTSSYKSQADDLFRRLMGQPITYFQQNAAGDCEEVKEKLTTAFIIFEPLTQVNGYVGTASEIAIIFHNVSIYKFGMVAKVYNALRVNPAVGNRGLRYFSAVNEIPTYSNSTPSRVNTAISNTHLGYGVAILAYGTEFVDENEGWVCNFDYTIDAACMNCNSNRDDNKAYIIQDTTNWDAIFASPDSDNKNVQSYYSKGNGVYCREEYTVYLPNVNNTISVQPGRYFTLNPSAKALQNVVSSPAIPNFKPVRVVKKIQCKVNSEENSSNAATVLDVFRRNSEYDFKGKTGTVSFKYNETYKDSRYNMDDLEEMSVYDEDNNYKYSIDNGTLNMEVTRYYTLPANYYQYIRKQDGLSMKVKPSDKDLGQYINVGIPNLPVSFNNTGDSNSIAADIQFSYALPTNDQYSKLNKAYIEDNSYLDTDNETGNVYKRYKTKKMVDGDQELLNNSACAKMFGINNTSFETCVSNRQNNSIGDKDKNANCIVNNKITNSTKSGYSCLVLLKENTCRIENGKYYDFDGNEITKEEYDIICPNANSDNTCRIENGKYYDFDGKEITKEEYDRICPSGNSDNTCRIENGKYYDFDGKEITKEEYDRICPSYIPSVCPEDECPYGCCPSGECAPMPDGTCPGSGGIDVIYRTIDLVNPFPGQDAEQRHTGANWCSYNIKTHKIDCKYNNATVKNYITRERGGTENGGKVYREDHVLYEVTLDSSTIGKIRDYNDDHKYDDWELNCLDNGRACISEFLRKQVKTTGKCSSVSKTSFYTCDEDV